VAGISVHAWDRLVGGRRPAGLHPFTELRSGPRHAPATPGDLLFHIRAARMDLCFELATENPEGRLAFDSVIIGAEDPAFAGGSYVIVQKYLHDIDAWHALPVEQQERVIGRTKLADIELDDAVKPSYAHNALTTITEGGREVKIVRDNMPFGSVAAGEYGTYFIGYARSPSTIELMLRNMFIGRPEGNYDRVLDVSQAVTGGLFFVPSGPLLESLGDDEDEDEDEDTDADTAGPEPALGGSLNIGSLRGVSHDE
jgi:porphyrinogen peroxidase